MEVVGWIGRNGDRGEWKKEEEGMRKERKGWKEMDGWIERWLDGIEMVGWRAGDGWMES